MESARAAAGKKTNKEVPAPLPSGLHWTYNHRKNILRDVYVDELKCSGCSGLLFMLIDTVYMLFGDEAVTGNCGKSPLSWT